MIRSAMEEDLDKSDKLVKSFNRFFSHVLYEVPHPKGEEDTIALVYTEEFMVSCS